MSPLIIKQACSWVHVPATDEIRSYWINLATVRKVTWCSNPVRCTLYFADRLQQQLAGTQAIAILDAIKELTGETNDSDD